MSNNCALSNKNILLEVCQSSRLMACIKYVRRVNLENNLIVLFYRIVMYIRGHLRWYIEMYGAQPKLSAFMVADTMCRLLMTIYAKYGSIS